LRKKVLVTADRGETRVAILEAEGEPAAAESAQKESGGRRRRGRGRRGGAGANGANGDWKVAELYIERRGNRSIVGNVYKGKVDNVLPGLEAAFVDIGLEKNGFLHVDDIVMPGVEIARRGRVNSKGKRISELLKPGQEILVQVMKDPLKTKGARLSMQLSIAGRYLVYVPDGEGIGVSRRLSDKERDRLRKETKGLDLQGGGAIIRTAAAGAGREDFEREVKYLFKLYELLQQRAEKTPAPAMVFQEADLSVRVVRDIFSDQFEKAIVDDEKQHHRLVSFFTRTAPELVDRVESYDDDEPLFEAYDVDKEIQSTLSRRVDLPSGGYLIIDYAEAMTVVDINSGSFTGRGKGARLEDTITKTNLEAAEEVVRQLRLRDIGGIIVIDFIDMARARNRDAVLKTLRNMLEEDRTKTYVMEVSPLGLVEMTRQNVTDGVREILTKTCPVCNGEGVVLSEETVALQVERKLRDLVAERPEPKAFLIQVHPSVSNLLVNGPGRPLIAIEDEVGRHFLFEGSEGLPIDTFNVLMEGSLDSVTERALPFREGEEVLVKLEEPHMYNEDDAVAKIDGYLISVTAAGRNIGEQKLVRIERVGRSSATATLVDANAPADGGDHDDDDDDDDSPERPKRTRRGRRGGRGRSKKSETAETAESAAE
jgi:ribonuclease G